MRMPSEVLKKPLLGIAACAVRLGTDARQSRMTASLVRMRSLLIMELGNGLLGVEERAFTVASPEVGEDDHAGDGGVGTPKRGEGVALDLHYNQEDCQVGCTEEDHRLDLREKQRSAGCDHINHRHGLIVGCLIDVDDGVGLDVDLRRECRQRPEYIERGSSAEDEEWQHALAAVCGRLEKEHAKRQQEREQSLSIEHECRAHVVGDRRRENTIEAEPDESLDELMNGEQDSQRGEKEFAAVLHPGQCDYADGSENSAADKVRCG